MKKKYWISLGIGGIVLYLGMILCCLLVIQLGSEYQIGQELLDASDEAYHFNPQIILSSSSKNEFFEPIPLPENSMKSISNIRVFWKQEEYFQVLDLFMKKVLKEQLQNWQLYSVASTTNCMEPLVGQMFPQGMSIEIFREIKAPQPMRQDFHIIIEPDQETIIALRREYYPYEKLEYIKWAAFNIPVEQAMLIADQQGGAVVRTALNNECEISAVMTAGIQKSDWRISYSPTNKPSVFEVAVDEKTGKYRILREFEK